MQLFSKQYSDQGEPLIILHGLFGNQGNWSAHARKLAEHYAVYAFDARNHGKSPWADSMTYVEMAHDVEETMDALGIDKAHFIGHSMGGKTVMQLALLRPERINKLMVVDIAPVAYEAGPYAVLEGMLAIDVNAIADRAGADKVLQDYEDEPAVRDFLLTNLIKKPGGGFQWRINLPVLAESYPDIKGWPEQSTQFSGQTLFVKGAFSDYLMSDQKPQILQLFPNSEVKIIIGAGHWVHSEKPEAFLKVTFAYFASE